MIQQLGPNVTNRNLMQQQSMQGLFQDEGGREGTTLSRAWRWREDGKRRSKEHASYLSAVLCLGLPEPRKPRHCVARSSENISSQRDKSVVGETPSDSAFAGSRVTAPYSSFYRFVSVYGVLRLLKTASLLLLLLLHPKMPKREENTFRVSSSMPSSKTLPRTRAKCSSIPVADRKLPQLLRLQDPHPTKRSRG